MVVGEPRECALESVLVYMANGTYKGVVHTVTHCALLVYLAIHFELHARHRLESVGGCYHVAHKFHLLVRCGVLEYITHDVRQVFLCDELFLVAQFDYSVCHTTCLLRGEFKSKLLKVLEDICLSGVLAKRILTLATKSLRQEVVAVEAVLVVAIGMHSCHLCEDGFAYYRFVWRYGNT